MVQGATPLGTGAAAEERVLERGIPVRCIYERALPATREGQRYLERWRARGERQRVLDRVPIRAAVIDRATVLAPVAYEDETITTLLIVRAGLGAAIAQLFDLLWAMDAPRTRSTLRRPLTAQETAILGLMCDGASDQGIARTLDIGVRTVQRRVHELSQLLDAPSRAALAARAVAYGLVQPFLGSTRQALDLDRRHP